MQTIREHWTSFNKKVIHPHACQIQRDGMKGAFYSGGAVVMNLLLNADDGRSEDAAVVYMEGLHDELDGYFESIDTEPEPIPKWACFFIETAHWMHTTDELEHVTGLAYELHGFRLGLHLVGSISTEQSRLLDAAIDIAEKQGKARFVTDIEKTVTPDINHVITGKAVKLPPEVVARFRLPPTFIGVDLSVGATIPAWVIAHTWMITQAHASADIGDYTDWTFMLGFHIDGLLSHKIIDEEQHHLLGKALDALNVQIDPWHAGWEAGKTGQPSSANPYPPCASKHEHWHDGWEDFHGKGRKAREFHEKNCADADELPF